MPVWKLGGQTGEAASQKTPALALTRRNGALEAAFALQLQRRLGPKGVVQHLTARYSAARPYTQHPSGAPASRSRLSKRVATAAALWRADPHAGPRHGATRRRGEAEGDGGAQGTASSQQPPSTATATDHLRKAGRAGGCGRAAPSPPEPGSDQPGRARTLPPRTSPLHQLSLCSICRSPPRPSR